MAPAPSYDSSHRALMPAFDTQPLASLPGRRERHAEFFRVEIGPNRFTGADAFCVAGE